MRPQPRAYRLAEGNQAFVELQPESGRKNLFQGKLALLWGFRVNHSPAIRNPMNVNIDGQALLIAGDAQRQGRALWADPWKGEHCLLVAGNRSTMRSIVVLAICWICTDLRSWNVDGEISRSISST